jgi:hypothetical protein
MGVRFCRRCGTERSTYEDVIANQHAERCARCHLRVADGPLLEREERCLMLTPRELSRDEAAPFYEELANWRIPAGV